MSTQKILKADKTPTLGQLRQSGSSQSINDNILDVVANNRLSLPDLQATGTSYSSNMITDSAKIMSFNR